jgi:hypothetical protein
MKTADEYLAEASETFKAKNAEYGTNYLRVGAAMAAMFPDGVTLRTADDWNRMHIFLLAVVKKTRYATNWEKGGHADSVRDETVYNAMLESIDAEISGRGNDEQSREAAGKRSRNVRPTRRRLIAK